MKEFHLYIDLYGNKFVYSQSYATHYYYHEDGVSAIKRNGVLNNYSKAWTTGFSNFNQVVQNALNSDPLIFSGSLQDIKEAANAVGRYSGS